MIGWYLPPWLAEAQPELKDWKNLNKAAAQFKTSESGGKGQLLDGDPSFVTNDEALVKNLKLDYKVVYAGSETALIQAFRDAEKNKKPVIGYFYEPQWFFNELKLVKVDVAAVRPRGATPTRRRWPATTRRTTWTRSCRRSSPTPAARRTSW